MAKYAYLAVDPQGRERRGAVDAASTSAAREQLAKRRWHVLRVDEKLVGTAPAKPGGFTLPLLGRKLTTKQLSLFTRQLSSLMMVSPLEEALRTISRQTEKDKARAILTNVHAGIVEGLSLIHI